MLVDQKLVQLEEPLGVRRGLRLDAPVLQHVLEQPVDGHGGVVDVGDRRLTVEAPQQRAEQRGLAGPDLAGQHDEALALAHAIDQLRQRLAMARRLEEELGIRSRTERRLVQAVELEVHTYLLAIVVSAGISMPTRASLWWAMANEDPTTTSRPTATAAVARRRCRTSRVRSRSVAIVGMVESTGTGRLARTSSTLRYEVSTCSASTTARPPAPSASTRPTSSSRSRLGPVGRSGKVAGSMMRYCSPFLRCSRSEAISASPRLASSERNISRVVS